MDDVLPRREFPDFLRAGRLHPLYMYEGDRNAAMYYARRHAWGTMAFGESDRLEKEDYCSFFQEVYRIVCPTSVVALGCGNLARECYIFNKLELGQSLHLAGVDLSRSMLAFAKATAAEANIPVQIVESDILSPDLYAELRGDLRAPIVFSLLGGTLNNYDVFRTLSQFRKLISKGEFLWIDFPLCESGDEAKLFSYLRSRLSEPSLIEDLAVSLRQVGINAEDGEFDVTMVDDLDHGYTKISYVFRSARELTVSLEGALHTIEKDAEIVIYGYTRTTNDRVMALIQSCGFNCLHSQAVKLQAQYLLADY